MDNNMSGTPNNSVSAAPGKKGITVSWQMIAALILLIIIAVFAYVNTHSVELSLVFTRVSLPLIVVILASMLVGMLLLLLVQYLRKRAKKRKIG